MAWATCCPLAQPWSMFAGVHSHCHCHPSLQPVDKGLLPWHLGQCLHAHTCAAMKNQHPQVSSITRLLSYFYAAVLSRSSPCPVMHQAAYNLFSQPFAGPMHLQTFKSYKNDLFGDEDGDVLAAETIPAAKPIEVAVPRPTTPSNRVQQQIALNQQKRLARLQVTNAPFILLSIPGKQHSSCCIRITRHSFASQCGANQCVAGLLKHHHHITTATAQHDPQCVITGWLCTSESAHQSSL